MDCPKCGKKIGDKDNVCSNCGVVIKENAENTKLSTKLFGKKNVKKNPLATSKLGKTEKLCSRFSMKHLKIFLAIAAVLILIALVVTLVVSISSGKGKKLARNTAEYLGKTVAVAESKLDVHFKDKSAFSVLNKALEFDYVEESEDSGKVEGTKYPEWAYCDFKLLKKDVRGVECDKIINLDRFDEGADYSKVNSEIGIDPYSISYSEKLVTYRYRYWFENDSGDQQQVVLDVSYDDDNHFLYYTSNMVYPENL